MISDGAWRRAARVALLLIAGLTLSAAPRSPFSAPAPAAAAPGAVARAGQADPDSVDLGEDVDDGEAPPVPAFEDEPPASSPDTSGVRFAPRDSSAILRVSPPDSAPAETLRYVPPGERPAGTGALPARPGDEPAPIVKKPKGGLFGLPPIFIILGLTVAHIFVVKAVTD